MYFHTDNLDVVDRLMFALTAASSENRKVRLDVDDNGRLRFKIGEGMWSEPISSTPDPYRDNS